MKPLEQATVTGQTILLRLDLNVPMKGTTIVDDYRLRRVLPTINFLLNRQAKVVLISHLGRPKNQEPDLSLEPVFRHLSELLKKPIAFAPEIFSPKTTSTIASLKPGELLGLQNIRFESGEVDNSRTFARKLAQYGQIYVNDAFAVSHREAASICAITEFLPSYAGLLLEQEVQLLTSLTRHPAHPFVGVIGGAKIKDKLPVVRHLLERVDHLLIGGAVANTFLAASGLNIRQSLVESDLLPAAKELLKRAKGKIILPSDYLWGDEAILDIGSKTIAQFSNFIHSAKTIFWMGAMGKLEEPKFANGSLAIAQTLAANGATSVVGGGDTIKILTINNLTDKVSFISTGGGATLAFLAGETLPGLIALE